MTHPVFIRYGKRLVAGLAACLAMASHAAPGNTDTASGTATVTLIEPPSITAIDDLRFGRIMSLPAAGTVTIAPGGAVTSTIDLTGTPSIRGPGRFLVFGERNRRFITVVSPSTVIVNENGTPMVVTALNYNRPASQGQGQAQHNRTNQSGFFDLYVGGTLNVLSNQEPGEYSGIFEVTVVYL
ncbi:DUF4402 domain-containing protein [Altererythrobacter sp. Z27]|uniref:DUF4402 domain-containing protein n=1 Tax=Altererythrobacter sp. Z27 TaxID=3461147 RepID=UPI004043A744